MTRLDETKRKPIEAMKDRKARAEWLIRRTDAALEAGEIDEEEWHRQIQEVITAAYLAADTPWGQSGKSGDGRLWTHARSLICDAIEEDGTFLDVGCANGYLMECMERWAAERGHRIKPYGLDISLGLADLARSRLPTWADRIYTGNVMTWSPPQRFDFVRTGLEYVPLGRRRDLVHRLLDEFVASTGRLIIGTYGGESVGTDVADELESEVSSWGFNVSGRTSRPHHRDDRPAYRAIWIDAWRG